MKILYLVSGIGPPAGWGTEFIQDLIFDLARTGVDATVINPIYPHTHPEWRKWTEHFNKKKNITIVPLLFPYSDNFELNLLLTPLYVSFAAFQLMKSEKFDLVHEFSSTPVILFRSLLFKMFFGVRTVFTLSVLNSTIFGKFFWFKIFDFASKYLIPSREIISDLKRMGISLDKILYSPPGIQLNKFKYSIEKDTAKQKFDLPRNRLIISYYGSLTVEKGVDDLLTAIRVLEPQLFGKVLFCFFSIWKGSSEHLEFKKRILEFNNDYVRLYDGYSDIPAVFAATDLFILPQQTGHGATIPIVSPIEVLVAHKKMISTNILGTREFIETSNSELISPKDPSAIIRAVLRFIEKKAGNDPTYGKEFNFINEFSLQKSIKLHLSLYRSLSKNE